MEKSAAATSECGTSCVNEDDNLKTSSDLMEKGQRDREEKNNKYDTSYCANCGKGEEDSNKLKACTACKMVKYCNRECQLAHRPQHKKECKKRAAQLHDVALFADPPKKEDCPICFERLPLLKSGWRYYACCGKVICCGCIYAVETTKTTVIPLCPFCRIPAPTEVEELNKRRRKRLEAGDAIAIHQQGCDYRDGRNGYPQDYTKALELWHQAGELGHSEAYVCIGYFYDKGRGVERDKKKAIYHYELAAMKGSVSARYNLGAVEQNAGNFERAIKHYMIATRSGSSESLEFIKKICSDGHSINGDYTKALQLYQSYLGEIKSSQRDDAAEFDEEFRYIDLHK